MLAVVLAALDRMEFIGLGQRQVREQRAGAMEAGRAYLIVERHPQRAQLIEAPVVVELLIEMVSAQKALLVVLGLSYSDT
tara:strand:- start:292 stop:531 length:240 start_codon:yes stop_codon:yes gene_type:complete